MKNCEFTGRDSTGRIGRLRFDETEYTLPGVFETDTLFPALPKRRLDALFPHDDPEFIRKFFSWDGELPIPVHIHTEKDIRSGETIITPNWHTLLAQPRELIRHLLILKTRIPPDTCWYFPGVALPENVSILVHAGFDLFDYTQVDLKTTQGIFCLPDGEYQDDLTGAGLCQCPGCQKGDLWEHNRTALRMELALIRQRIQRGTFREFLEGKVRSRPEHVSLLRYLDRSNWMEEYTPACRQTPFIASSGDSIHRPEVKRFTERLLTRYIRPLTDVAVLLPCSARKPYSLSQSHHRYIEAIGRRAHELILTSPLGVVPRDLELIYPAAMYDVPVTGYWDHEERYQISETLTKYLVKQNYRRVLAHLDGDALLIAKEAADAAGITLESTCATHPGDHESLNMLSESLKGEKKVRNHLLRGMISFQFGYDLRASGLEMKGSYPEVVFKQNRRPIFSIEPSTGMVRPSFEGWAMIDTGYRVYIDNFIPQGDILAPGVIEADPAIRPGDEVLVIGDQVRATGRAVMGADEMRRSNRGVAVRVRKIKKFDT